MGFGDLLLQLKHARVFRARFQQAKYRQREDGSWEKKENS